MARREIYNTIDCKERLLLIGIGKDEYGGYKQDLLEKDLGEMEIDFYVCVKCNGLMRNACLVNGPDPILVCEVCKTGEDSISMVKARKNISRLRAKCPLKKRGCVWKGSLGEIDAHLNECAEFFLNCSNACGVLLKRSELQNHCENECQLRIVKCKYCEATIQHKLLENHNRICQEFPLVCPNECLKSLIRKELKSHIEKECPNTLIACPYKEMGCEVLSKRSELPKHENTFESKHLDQTNVFYFNKVKKLESIIQDQKYEIKQLTAIQFTSKSQERSAPSLDESYIIEEKHSKICEEDRTNSMSVIGLQNLGSTCCLNSVLQNLLYLRPFRDQLIRTMNRTEYKLVPKKHPYLETLTFAYSDKQTEPGKLTKELFKLINETTYQKSLRTVTPEAVLNEIVGKSGKFSDVTQQDSHGLFRFLIDMVKDEEIQRLKTAFFVHFDINNHILHFKNYPEDGNKLLRKYAGEFESVFVFTGTFIDYTFGGKIISTVKCDSCRKSLNINEDFLDISLQLSADSKKTVDSREVFTNDSLEFYLMRFFSPIFLEEDYVCNCCNPQLVSEHADTSDARSDENDYSDFIDYDALKFTSAVKQFHIKTVGPVLTIHLKRFSQTGFGLQKLNKRVVFPLVLDMSPFCVSDTSILKDCDGKVLYGLRGIVDHTGGIRTGHCMAYVNLADWNVPSKIPSKDNTKSRTFEESSQGIYSTYEPMDTVPTQHDEVNKLPHALESNLCKHVDFTDEWYFISDTFCYETDRYHVLNSQAYILFYERLPLVDGYTLL